MQNFSDTPLDVPKKRNYTEIMTKANKYERIPQNENGIRYNQVEDMMEAVINCASIFKQYCL